MYRYLVLVLILVVFSCEEQGEIPEPVRTIPESVNPYVDRFLWEAEKRGINLDISNLSIEFDRNINIPVGNDQQTVVGSCTRTRDLDLVKIDTLNSLWLLSGYLGREEIIFHELGHCLLNRAHRDDKFISGDYASIMRSVGLLQYGDLNNYTTLFTLPTGLKAHRRDYYIDELFEESINAPCWADSNALPVYPVTEFDEDFILNREYRNIWVDSHQNLWLFGYNANHRYRHNIGFDNPLSGIDIDAMANAPDGAVWVAGTRNGQNLIGTIQAEDLAIEFQSRDLPADLATVQNILIDDLHRVWIGDSQGNIFVNQGTGFEEVALPSTHGVSSFRQGPNNNIYLLKGGNFYRVANSSSYELIGKENSDLPVDNFRDLEVDNRGVAWLRPASNPEYILWFAPDYTVTRVDFPNVNLAEIRINDMSCDHSGEVWIATSHGIRKWEGQSFSNYCAYNTGLKILDFRNILVGNKENIWSIGKDPVSSQWKLLLSQPEI